MTEYCAEYGMVINPSKSKFMVVNGAVGDGMPITSGECTISHCDDYTYLGTIFTMDGKFTSMMARHTSAKYCNLLKLFSFAQKNRSIAVPTEEESV